MKRILLGILVVVSVISCQSKPKKVESQNKPVKVDKREGIMEEYKAMKAKLEPQGYIITTDSVDKIFIDHAVTINYHDKKKK